MISKDREYRTMTIQRSAEKSEENSYQVRGYASTFEPYVLFSQDGVDYSEQIDPTAMTRQICQT
jgi:hypothetical protein